MNRLNNRIPGNFQNWKKNELFSLLDFDMVEYNIKLLILGNLTDISCLTI